MVISELELLIICMCFGACFGAGLRGCNVILGYGLSCTPVPSTEGTSARGWLPYARMIVTLRPFKVVAFLVCKRSINAGAFLRLSKMHNHP